jgi:hypothetical protein
MSVPVPVPNRRLPVGGTPLLRKNLKMAKITREAAAMLRAFLETRDDVTRKVLADALAEAGEEDVADRLRQDEFAVQTGAARDRLEQRLAAARQAKGQTLAEVGEEDVADRLRQDEFAAQTGVVRDRLKQRLAGRRRTKEQALAEFAARQEVARIKVARLVAALRQFEGLPLKSPSGVKGQAVLEVREYSNTPAVRVALGVIMNNVRPAFLSLVFLVVRHDGIEAIRAGVRNVTLPEAVAWATEMVQGHLDEDES